MAQAFNLTAQLNLRGPANIKNIVADIKRQLGTVQGTVNFTIDPKTTRNIGQLESALRTLNTTFAQTQNSATAAANAIRTFNSSIGNISSSTNNISRSLNNASSATQNLGKQTTATAQQTKVAIGEMEEFGRQSALAVRRFAAFSSVTSVIFAFTNALTKGMTAFVAFDKEFVKLQQVTDSSASQLKGLSDEITRLSKGFGVASSDLMTVASTLAQAGLSAKDTERALKALALTDLAPSFDSMNETVEGSIALMRQFNIGAKDLEKALGSVNSVAAVFAVEASDIITAIQRTGGVFANASKGVSQGTDALNEFIAVFTSVRQTTRESAETIATGLRTIFTRIQRESTIESLREFGVVLTDLEGKFVGPYEAVRKLSEGLSRLDPRDLKFSQIVEELGGFRQIGKVIPLIQQFSTAQEALGVAQRGQGSLAQDAIKAQLSLANQMSKVREEFLALMRDIGNSDTFQAIAKSALGFTSVLIKVADTVKGILPVLAIMGAGKAASGIAQFATGFLGGLKKGPDGQAGGSSGGGAVGSGGILSRITGGGNNQANIGVRELILVADALRNNTSSLGLNTAAIQDLTRVISNSSGGSPFAAGGAVRKFARGGVVPGSGNRDTVPAMLQPGEFVIRKKAVETIGASNLHDMNKYGGGGSIRAGRSNKRKKFASGGKAPEPQEVITNEVYDGDSLSINFTPKAEPYSSSSRLLGVDAYEINSGPKWQRNLGFEAKSITSKFYKSKQNVTSDFSKGYERSGAKKDKYGRPFFENELLKQELLDKGLAYPYSGGSKPQINKEEYLAQFPANKSIVNKKNIGGIIQKFMAGGKAKETRSFGTGEFPFPKRISNAYFKEIDAALGKQQVEKVFDNYPQEKRINIEPSVAQESFAGVPFNKTLFIESFKDKLGTNNLYKSMSSFAKFIGLPQEDLSLVLPQSVDFTKVLSAGRFASGQFDRTGMGSRDIEGYDLSTVGFTKADEQDLYGYQKLIEEKKKQVAKIIKTPIQTFDDGSFIYDAEAVKPIWDEVNALEIKALNIKKKKSEAEQRARKSIQDTAMQTGRGSVSMSTAPLSSGKNDIFYHELTHQLLNGLRTRSAESFEKYKSRVVSLFGGDNDDLSDAFDALENGYNSSDVVYGRSYKVGALDQVIQQNRSINRGSRPAQTPEAAEAASRLWAQSLGIKKAKDFKPVNPAVNKALLDNSVSQSIIDRYEDSGKEEFLTTLVQNAPKLDPLLQSALDSTLSELLGSVGIKRQQFAEGGEVQLLRRGSASYSYEDIEAAAKRSGMTFDELKAKVEERQTTGFKDFVIPEWDLAKKYGLKQYRQPPTKAEEAVQGAIIAKQDRIAAWKKKKGLGTSEYEGKSRREQNFLQARGRYNLGGLVQTFAEGGQVLRNIGIIDTDVLRDPSNASVVSAAMQKLGISDTSEYTTKLGELATKARKSGSLSKLRAIAGAAGSGKSSLATGKGVNDNASLRKTIRSQILTPEDIDKVNEVIILTSTASQSKLDAYLKDIDRAYVLSSNNKNEQDQIRSNRDSRDTSGEGLYGRKPGTTRGASADFGLEETILRDELGKKATVLGRKENSFGLRRKQESELPEIIQAGGFYTGGFAPPTRGHRGALDTLLENMLAKNPNASLEDIVVSVAPDLPMIAGKEGVEHAARYGIFPADFRALLSQANFGDAMISTQDQPPGGLPKFMEVSGAEGRRRFARLKGAMAITSGKDEGVLGKYERAGMDVKDIPRIEDISATKVRDALFAGDDKTLTSFLDPNIASVLMGNRAQLRNRSMMVPMLIEEIQKFVDQEKIRSNQEVEQLLQSAPGGPYKNVSAKLKETAPGIASQIQEIRSQRDRLSRGAFGYRAFNVIRALSSKYPGIYGLDPSRKSGVSAQASDISREAIAAQLSEQMSGEFGGVPATTSSALEDAILQNVEKATKVDKSSGILPAKGDEILRRFANLKIPDDTKFGEFAGKTVFGTRNNKGKLPYWLSATSHLMMKPEKETAYISTRDYLINKFNQSQGTQKATTLAETTNAVLSSKQLGLVGLNPLGYTGLLGPETWNLGVDSSGQERSIDASIIQRGLPTQYKSVIDYLSGQTEELVGGAAKLLGISPKKLSQKERETLGQGNIEGALLEQIFGSAGATVLDDALRTRPIDFPMGIGPKAAKIFGIDPNIPTEVKRTIDSGSRGKAVEEFQRYFRQQYGIPEPEQQMQAFAAGGGISGRDTVPALLTPGEFVINKKAAQNIGYTELGRLNKADKIQGYNKGGYVGIQKFAAGGSPESIDVGRSGAELQEKRFLLDAKSAERQKLETKRSEATDPDEIQSLTKEMQDLVKEMNILESAISTIENEFNSLTDDIEVFTIDAKDAGKALRESISAKFESVTGNKPSEAKIDEIQREAIRTGGKVKTDKGDMDFTDRTRDVVNAKNNLENRIQDRESKFGKAKKKEDLVISSKDFISKQNTALREEQEKKNQLTTKASTASGGEKILLRDQIAETDGAIAKLKASIEAAEQAYSIAAQQVKEASSAETAAQAKVEAAEQSLVDALKDRITDWENLSDERKSQAINQIRETGQITDKAGNTQSFDITSIKDADSALAAAREQKSAAESKLEEVSGKSSGAETAERDVIEAATRRADADAYVALMAKQSGMSVAQFSNKLKKDIGSTFMSLKNEVPKALGAARGSMLQNKDKLGSTDEKVRDEAKRTIQDKLRQAIGSSEVSGVDDAKLQAMVDRLADNVRDAGMSISDAIDSTDGLSEALDDATSQARLQARAIEAVAAESGVAADRLEEMGDAAVEAAQTRARTDEQGRRMQAGLGYAAMGASIVGQVGANMFDPNSREGAVGSAVVGGAGQTAGVGLALAGQAAQIPVVGPAIASLVAAGTAAAVVAGAFKDAHNAAREFEKTLANKNLQMAMDRTTSAFEEFEKDIKNINFLNEASNQLNIAGANTQKIQDIDNNVPKAFWVNMFDALGASTPEETKGAADRSKILEKEGITGYLRSTSTFGGAGAKDYTSRKMAGYAPEQAVEQAKTFKPVADATLQLFENKLKTGTSMADVMKELKTSTVDSAGNIVEAPTQLAKNIALANPVIQEQIMLVDQNNNLSAAEKQTIKNNIIAKESERTAALNLEKTLRELEINKLNKATNAYVNSLERTFKQMEVAIGRASFELDQLTVSSEAYNSALSGSAKASQVNLKSINVLQNSRAYSGSERDAAGKQAGEFFGGTSGNLEGMLKIGDQLENNIISTINRTIQEDPNASEEKIAAKIRTNTESTVQDAGLSKDLSGKLAKEVQKAVSDIRKGGDKGSIGFDELVEKVPALGKTLDGARRAQELANKALEYWQKNLNEYANAMNQSMEMQLEANSLGRKAIDIQNKGSMELQRALGKEVTLREQVSSVLDSTSRQTKGISAPSAIGDSIVKLNDRRTVEQGMSDTAANRGASGKNEFIDMQQRLRNTNMALRENYDALKNMADNTEIASAALAKINEVQQKRQAGVNIAERLVTSSPEELSKLNSAMGRLSNNMAGIQNVGTTSDQRRESLDAFNMIAPLLGQDQGAMKANMLESMLGESGVGVSPMMKDVLDSLRNPEEDPMMREAIETYKMGVNLQSDANSELARMNQLMSDNTAEVAAEKIAQSLSKVELSFETQIMDDMRKGIRRLVEIEEGKKDDVQNAQGKARGGLIYAAAGQMVDFAPKGTDTVPAMLTPGEFVVNRSATQKNLPLLKSINSNKYSSGGKVRYYNEGGWVGVDSEKGGQRATNNARAIRSNLDSEQETTSSYPPVFNFPNKMIPIFTAFGGSISAVASRDQAGKILSNYFFNSKDTKDGAQLNIGTSQSVLGPAVTELELYGNDGEKAEVYDNGILPGTRFKEIARTLDFSGSSNNLDYKPIKMNQRDKYIELAKQYIDKLKFDDSAKNQIDKVKYELPPPPNPTLEYTEGGRRDVSLLTNPFGAKLKNLSERLPNNFNYGLFSGDFDERLKETAQNKPAFYGFNVRTPAYPAYVSAGESATTKGPYFDMDPYTFAHMYKTREHIDPTHSVTAKLVSDNKENVMKSIRLMTDLDIAYSALTGQKKSKQSNAKFEETQDSLDNKKYIKNLEELYYGTKLSATFDSKETLRVPDEESQYPVTLYSPSSIQQEKWQQILDKVKKNGSGYASSFTDGIKLRAFDKEGNPKSDEIKSFPYLDSIAADNQQVSDILKGAQADFNADPTKANVFDAGSGVFDNGRYYFTYQKLKARFFNDTARRFMGAGEQLKDFIVIRDQAKESAGLNPFSDLEADKNVYIPGHDINTLISQLDARDGEYGTPPAGQSGSPGSKPENVTPYKYKLKKILKADNTGDLAGIEKSWAFKSNGSDNEPALTDMELIAKKYTLAREQELLKGGLSTDKADTSKVFSSAKARKQGESDEDYKARMDEQKQVAKTEAWTEAKRVTLARKVYEVASQAGLRFQSSMPIDIPSVGGVAMELGQYITKMPTDSPQRAMLDAYARFFGELYNNGETAKSKKESTEGSDSGPFLKSLGIDISDKAFGGPGPATRVPGSTTETRPAYFTSTTNDAAKINAVLARQFMAERSKQFAGSLGDKKKEELTIDSSGTGAKIYTVNPDGTKSLRKAEEIVPQSYADIFDIALTPENLFPDANIRQKYLDQLISYYKSAADARGQALFTPEMSQPFVNSLSILKSWYKIQDSVLNASRTPEELLAIRGGLEAAKNGTITDTLKAQFQESTGMSVDEVIAQAQDARAKAQEANAFLTTNKYGELPNLERMMSLLNVQAAAKESEEQQKTQALSSGGVVYASTGKLINFQPRGTDTVPAMLTPGEFVVNRGATQKHLPVLEAINSGNYSRGDIVQHLSRGGVASGYYQVGGPTNAGLAGFDFSSFMSSLVSQVSSAITEAAKSAFDSIAKSNTSSGGVSNSGTQNFDGISDFTNKLDRISSTLASLDIPREITITGRHDVNVIINGDQALSQLTPNIKDMVMTELKKGFDKLVAINNPVPSDVLKSPYA